jgi:nucleotide-binding universal stress UspA family protein
VVAASEAVAREFELPDFHATVVNAPSVGEALGEELERGYDVVFLGLDGRRPLSHRLLRGLLAAGHADVVLVRAAEPARDFRRILLPVTGSVASRAAAELAFVYARETGAELQLVHVLDPGAAIDRRTAHELELLGGRMVDELVERGRREGASPLGRVLRSRFPPRAILAAASETRADLVIMGATPRYSDRRAYFGRTADLVLAHAPCAVALYVGGVRPEALRATTPEREAEALGQPERPAAPP